MTPKLKSIAIATFASITLFTPPARATTTAPVLAIDMHKIGCVIAEIVTLSISDTSCERDDSSASKKSDEPKAIPTPALLPGLIGMGIAAIRKRRSASAKDV